MDELRRQYRRASNPVECSHYQILWLVARGQSVAEVARALQGPALDGGLWSGPTVAAWTAQQVKHPVHPQRGWDYLLRLGYRLQQPRPRHAKA